MMTDAINILNLEKGDHKFEFFIESKGTNLHGDYVVYIKQTTDVSEFGLDPFQITYKCVCLGSPSESAAIHRAGKKYLKDWNTKARIGKDNPLK